MFKNRSKYFELPANPNFLEGFSSSSEFKAWFKKEAAEQTNMLGKQRFSDENIAKALDFFMLHAHSCTGFCINVLIHTIYTEENEGTFSGSSFTFLKLTENAKGNGGLKYPAYTYPAWMFEDYKQAQPAKMQQIKDTISAVGKRQHMSLEVSFANADYTIPQMNGTKIYSRKLQLSICPYN